MATSTTFWVFPLTKEEAKIPKCKGWAYMHAHEDRLIPAEAFKTVCDSAVKGSLFIIIDGECYWYEKDYMDITNDRRLYLAAPSLTSSDQVDKPEKET